MTQGVAEGAVNNSTGRLVKGQQCQTFIRSGRCFSLALSEIIVKKFVK